MLRRIITALAVLSIILASACAFSATYNLRDGGWDQWPMVNSDTSDPWTIGYIEGGDGSWALTPFIYSTANEFAFGTYGGLGYNYNGASDWDTHGNMVINTSDSQPINAWTAYWDPSDMVGGPGAHTGLKTTVEFKAPAAGTYKLNSVISGKSTAPNQGTTVDCYLYVNGVQLGTVKEVRGQVRSADGMSGPQGVSPEVSFDNFLELQAGDKVWVSFDCSPNGVSCDATGFSFEISTVENVTTLSGTVKDSGGNPISGATVTSGSASATTGADGTYSLMFDSADPVTVSVSAPGYVSQTLFDVPMGTQNFVLETRTGAATFYVDAGGGNDSYDGTTPETAWLTLNNIKNSGAVQPGDTVIATGTFGASNLSGLAGTADAVITVKAGDGGADISVADGATCLQMGSCSYVKIDGFDFTGGYYGINLTSSSNVEICNCSFQDLHLSGSGEGAGVWHNNSSNIFYHHNLFRNIGAPGTGPQGCITIISGSYDCRIYNNTFVYASNGLRSWNNVARIDVKNNIFVDMYGSFDGTGYIYSYFNMACDNSFICDTNIFWASDGSEPPCYLNNTTSDNDMVIDPKFVEYNGGTFEGNFNLTETSPAVDTGLNVGLPYNYQAPDIGAFESDYEKTIVFGRVQGYVTREGSKYVADNTPLAGATVTFPDGYSATTDGSGFYTVLVPVGEQEAVATYGYGKTNDTKTVTVTESGITQDFKIPLYDAGSVYYVATDGDDWGGDGSEDNPFASPNNPDLWEILEAGDTVVVKAGTYSPDPYTEGSGYVFNMSGDAMAPITYITDGDVTVDMTDYMELTAGGHFACFGFGVYGSSVANGIVVDGFTFTNSQFGVYFSDGGRDQVVYGCTFSDMKMPAGTGSGTDSYVGGVNFSVSDNVVAARNIFKNFDEDGAGDVAAIMAPVTSNGLFVNNTFDNTGRAFTRWAGASTGNVFANNIVMNMSRTAVNSGTANCITAYNNLFCNIAGGMFNTVTDGGNNFFAAPLLDSDYIPQSGSAAIDAGVDFGYTFVGSAPDLGAFETNYTGASVNKVVSARVVDGNGAAISGVSVTFDDAAEFVSAASGSLLTKEYRTTAGTLKVNASKAGYADYENTFTLESGDNEITIVMTFVQGSISGTVSNSENGKPIQGAVVSLAGGGSAVTDALGHYELLTDTVSNTITAEALNFATYTGTVDAVIGGFVTKDITLKPTAYIWDAYEDFSAAHNPNDVWSYGWEAPRSDVSTATNFVLFDGIGDGGQGDVAWRYQGGWDAYGYIGIRTADSVHNEWGQYREGQMLYMGSTVSAGNSTIRFTAPFDGEYNFDIVTSYNGLGGSGCILYIDNNGSNLYADDLTVFYPNNPTDPNASASHTFTLTMSAGDTVDVSSYSKGNPSMSIALLRKFVVGTAKPEMAVVEGTVTDEDGNPIPGAEITVDGSQAGTTDSDGFYSVDVSSTEFNLGVNATGYAPTAKHMEVVIGQTYTENFVLERTFESWDAYEDFSTDRNPNGVWSYGWEAPRDDVSTANPLVLFDGVGDGGQGDLAWRYRNGWDSYGYTGIRTADTVHSEWGQYREPHMLYLGSTFGSGNSAIRFTAPYAGTFEFNIVTSYNGMGGAGCVLYIDKNLSNLYADDLTASYQDDPTDPNASASHSFTLKLAAGDTVDVSSYSKAAPWNSIALVRQFTVTEVADQPETASSVADIKALEDGDTVITEFDLVALNDKGFFGDSSVYASAEDRLAGVRLDFSGVDNLVTAGDRVRVKGTVGTDAGGKYITVTEVTSSESGEKLLALATTKGTVDTGVLVRVWGKVVSKADGTFVLNNGSGDVTVIGTTDKAVGGFATVTGIATETGVKAMEVL